MLSQRSQSPKMEEVENWEYNSCLNTENFQCILTWIPLIEGMFSHLRGLRHVDRYIDEKKHLLKNTAGVR